MKLTKRHYILIDTDVYFYSKTDYKNEQYIFKGLYENEYVDFSYIHDYTIKKLSKRVTATTFDQIGQLQKDKRPTSTDKNNYVGIELEVLSKKNIPELMVLLNKKSLLDKVSVHDDSSIETSNCYRYSAEICIMDTQENIYKTITKVITLLKPYCSVNISCGMHVHLDMRHRNKLECVNKLIAAQPVLYSICSPDRERNSYCEPCTSEEYSSKYKGVNSRTTFKTVEVRMHHGTLNIYEINNWIALLLKIIESNLKGDVRVKDFNILNEFISDKTVIRYIKNGLKKYKYRENTEWRFVA